MEDLAKKVYSSGLDHKAQLETFNSELNQLFAIPNPDNLDIPKLLDLVRAVVTQETGSMVVSRQLIASLDRKLEEVKLSAKVVQQVAQGVLGITQPRSVSYSYDEQWTNSIRLKLANAYEESGMWNDAAQTLGMIPIESSQRSYTPVYKMELYLRMGRLFVEGGAVDEAESSATRASLLQAEAKSEQLNIEHKALMARVLDRKGKFVEAAQRYYELSNCDVLPNTDKVTALSSAMTCTILAAPGQQRTRLLSILCRDERARSVPCFKLLEKLFMERLIRVDELAEFERELTAWQKETHKGQSILRTVMIEHNMAAAGQVYDNISMNTLAELLGVDVQAAEKVAATMIASNRLKGHIDQIEGFVHFNELSPIELWDEQIERFCRQVEKTAGLIIAKHPEMDSTCN